MNHDRLAVLLGFSNLLIAVPRLDCVCSAPRATIGQR